MKDYLAMKGLVVGARLLGEDFVVPIHDEEHLLFSCKSTKDIRLRFAGLPMSSLRNLMQCEDVGSVA
jgi:hypothetical protein